ncbi:hypothetical protein D7Y27_39830 [Corallococcus sp. AB004]|nr:hypothetical protein D7Y27_39830 [Corallococcus sp. AB004]
METALNLMLPCFPAGGDLELERDSEEPVTAEFITKSMTVRDVPNGFALIESDDLRFAYEAALFKAPRDTTLVVAAKGGRKDRVVVFQCDLKGLKLAQDATKTFDLSREEILRLYDSAGLIAPPGKKGLKAKNVREWGSSFVDFTLPRTGRTIKLVASVDIPKEIRGTEVGTVEYVDQKFVVRPFKMQAP